MRHHKFMQSIIRDQFPITTWIFLGALIQGLLHIILPYRNIVLVLPVILIIASQAINTLLQLAGITTVPALKTMIPHRTTVAFPSSETGQQTFGDRPICMILLSIVSHHPLGMLAPGYKETGDRMDEMLQDLNAKATKHGFLGASAWINTERTTSNQTAIMLYFENEERVHAYAHGPLHTATLQGWVKATKGRPWLGIMHEIFLSPAGGWEGVYVNYHPTGLGATSKEVIGPDGETRWINPLIKTNGKLLYSKGRMGREVEEKEWLEFEKLVGQDGTIYREGK
ncbi:unnamed protein product [Periconia digitata]|uniref:Monooxygenase n=1 Tax=Periconia digitata TaxID=1303443 RepID=A0A9W4U5N3_9PLEO|nr:unnamed protein product [Periconia digitata]